MVGTRRITTEKWGGVGVVSHVLVVGRRLETSWERVVFVRKKDHKVQNLYLVSIFFIFYLFRKFDFF